MKCRSVPPGGCNWPVGIIAAAGRNVIPIKLRTKWAPLIQLIKELTFPSGWATYQARAAEFTVRPLGSCEVQGFQGSNGKFRLYYRAGKFWTSVIGQVST